MNNNALKHGCCAMATVLLPHETSEDFKSIETAWRKAYNPNSEPEYHMVSDLVNADFLLQRATKAVLDIERKLYAANSNPLDWTELQQRTLGRFLRYKTGHQNSVAKFRKAIEDYRKSRLNEKTAAEKQANAKERLEIYKRKNRPEPTWKEHLQNMKKTAQSMGYPPPDMSQFNKVDVTDLFTNPTKADPTKR